MSNTKKSKMTPSDTEMLDWLENRCKKQNDFYYLSFGQYAGFSFGKGSGFPLIRQAIQDMMKAKDSK